MQGKCDVRPEWKSEEDRMQRILQQRTLSRTIENHDPFISLQSNFGDQSVKGTGACGWRKCQYRLNRRKNVVCCHDRKACRHGRLPMDGGRGRAVAAPVAGLKGEYSVKASRMIMKTKQNGHTLCDAMPAALLKALTFCSTHLVDFELILVKYEVVEYNCWSSRKGLQQTCIKHRTDQDSESSRTND